MATGDGIIPVRSQADGGYGAIDPSTAGKVLTSNGVGVAPTFQTPGAGGITQLTGDVTAGPGSGSQAAAIAANAVTTAKINNAAVTLAKIANAAANSKVLGSGSSGSGASYSELGLGAGLSISGTTLNTVGGSGGSGIISSTGAEGSEPGSPSTGDLYFPNNGIYLKRWSGSAWIPWGPLFPMTEPVNGDFAWINQGTATVSTTNGGVYLLAPVVGSGLNWRIRKKSLTIPYTITMGFLCTLYDTTVAAGMIIRESGSGKFHSMHFGSSDLAVQKWTSATGSGTNLKSFSNPSMSRGSMNWFRITNNSTTRSYQISCDGQNFITFFSEAAGTNITEDEGGFAALVSNTTGDSAMMVFSYA